MTLVQKRLLTLLGLSVVAGGTLASVLWHDKQTDLQSMQKAHAAKFFQVKDKKSIHAITLQTPQTTLAFELSAEGEGHWQLTQPLATTADSSTIESMLESIVEVHEKSCLPKDKSTDLTLFGLDKPRYSLQVQSRELPDETLLVGSKNNFDNSLYVKRAHKDEVCLTNTSLELQLDKDAFKLREKRLAIFENTQVNRLEVTHLGKLVYVLEKKGSDWALTAKEQHLTAVPAETNEVNNILNALAGIRAENFVAESQIGVDLALFGLNKPVWQVHLLLNSGTQLQLALGQITTNNNKQTFAVQPGKGAVMQLGTDWALTKLATPIESLRNLQVLSVDRMAISSIKLERGDEKIVLHKQHDEKTGQDHWHLQEPINAAAQSSKVASLLYKLTTLKAERVVQEAPNAAILAKKGLETPQLRIELATDKEPVAVLLVGHTEGEQTYITTQAGHRLDSVAAKHLSDISTKSDDYLEQKS